LFITMQGRLRLLRKFLKSLLELKHFNTGKKYE
jgi:hypothetical protein